MRGVDWTDQENADLQRMADRGFSASRIAAALGKTRNAVVGRCHRKGVQLHGNSVDEKVRRVAPAPPPPQPAPVALSQVVRQGALVPSPQVRILEGEPAPAGTVTFAELEDWHCKWPFGDPSTSTLVYCGRPRIPGEPYCEAHVADAFVPTEKQKQQRQTRLGENKWLK